MNKYETNSVLIWLLILLWGNRCTGLCCHFSLLAATLFMLLWIHERNKINYGDLPVRAFALITAITFNV